MHQGDLIGKSTQNRDPELGPKTPLPIRDRQDLKLDTATAQELALELLVRARSDSFDGAAVYHELLERRADWSACYFWCKPARFIDRVANSFETRDGGLCSLAGLAQSNFEADHLWLIANDLESLEGIESLLESSGVREVVRHIGPKGSKLLSQPPAFALEAVLGPTRHVSTSSAEPSLTNASAQDICLEMIYRSSFNEFDGVKVHEWLTTRRNAWHSVIMSRYWNHVRFNKRDRLEASPSAWNTILDLPWNQWNQDSLFVLAKDVESARLLKREAKQTMGASSALIRNTKNTRLLTGFDGTGRLLELWWD